MSQVVTKSEFAGYQIAKVADLGTDGVLVPVRDVCAGPCTLYSVWLNNTSGATVYVKLYDKINPTPGTDAPEEVYEIATATQRHLPILEGLEFETALSLACSQGAGTENGTIASSGVTVVLVAKEGVDL